MVRYKTLGFHIIKALSCNDKELSCFNTEFFFVKSILDKDM